MARQNHQLKDVLQVHITLPFAKNLLGSEAVLSKSSSLVIKLSRCKITSVAISQNVRACNNETAYKLPS